MAGATAVSASQLTRRRLIQSAAAVSALALTARNAHGALDNGIVRTAEAIHQEVLFDTTPQRLYSALTDASQLQKVELLSAAAKDLDLKAHPATSRPEPGSSFSLYGGYITGRQIDLVPSQRITQAWRSASWPPNIYSLICFEFIAQGSQTKLVFDHVGFPSGTAEHLAAGWYANYWDPLKKFLG